MHPSTERALSPYAGTKKAGMSVIPVYDNGGEVTEAQRLAIAPLGKAQGASGDGEETEAQRLAIAPVKQTATDVKTPAGFKPIALGGDTDTPVYDEGGEVDLNDGKHQAAILEEGERVLTPEQNDQYKAEHPELLATEKDKAAQTVRNPGAQTTTSDVDTLIPERDTTKEGQQTQGHVLGQEWLKRIGVKPADPSTSDVAGPITERPTSGMPTIKTPASSVVPTETLALIPGTPENRAAKEYHQETAGGSLIPGAPSTYDKATNRDFAQMQYKATLADYDKRIQDAKDLATPEGQEQADRLTAAKLSFQKANPWGSAANHPGLLGKIGHVAEEVLSRAPISAGFAALVPGSEGDRAAASVVNRENLEKDTQLNTQRTAEEDKSAGVGVGKTTQELTFHDLMTGDNGKPRINPDTQKPYTAQEANVASQGTGKSSDELYIQDQMRQVNPDTGKPFTRREATENLLQLKAGNKPVSRQEQALKDYMQAQGLADTPANRDAARIAVARRDVQTKALAALPIQEQRSTFDNNLRQESALLEQTHADALQRGKSADEVQQKENARHEAVISKIQTAQDTVKSADESEFAAAIAPVTTLLAVTSAEGVKRVNRDELARFVPQNGDLWRWATTHTDQWLAGEIPDKYRDEVGKMLSKMEAQEDREHLANTHSVDSTIRQGAQTPSNGNKSEPSKTSAAPEGHRIQLQGGGTATKINGKWINDATHQEVK